MLSTDMLKLLQQGNFALAIWETIYMTLLSTVIAYVIGLPLGILLATTADGGIRPIRWLNRVLSVVVNVFRSFPFLILMVAMLPVAKLLVGTSLGNRAMIVMLVIAAAPYVARMVESSVKEVDHGIIEAAQSMGASGMQIVTRVLIPEAKPSLIVGAVISTVTVLGYSAMAGTIAGGGLGATAILWGHQRMNPDVTWACVIVTVIIVQILQEVGMWISRKTDHRVK